MHTQRAYSHLAEGLSRRELLHMGLAAGLTVSVLPSRVPRPSGVQKRDSPSAAASYACVAMTPCTSITTSQVTPRPIPP